MPLAAYTAVYRRFGLMAMLHDAAIGIINRLLYLRIQVVYLISEAADAAAPEYEIRLLTPAELRHYADTPGLDLPRHFIESALTNGDECFGVLRDGTLQGYAWFALRDVTFSNALTARFHSDYVHAYKNWTAGTARGAGIQKAVKAAAFRHYRAQGRRGIVVAIESQNFSSRRSTEGSGGRAIGYWLLARPGGRWFSTGTPGCHRVGYRLDPDAGTAPMQTSLQVELVDSLERWEQLGAAVQPLLAQSRDGIGFYYQPGCMRAMAPLYLRGGRERLFFLLVRDGERPLALAPLQLEHKSLLKGGLRRLHFWGGIRGSLNNMSGDILCAEPARAAECIAALLRFLQREARARWDLLDLPYVPEQSPAYRALSERLPGCRQHRESMDTFLIDLPTDYAAFCNQLPAKAFREMRRCGRRLSEEHTAVRCRLAQTLSAAERERIVELHRGRQDTLRGHGAVRHSLFEQPGERDALWGMVDFAERSAQGRFYLLEAEGRIIAFFIAFGFQHTLHLYLMSMDNTYAKYGPPKVLMLYLVQTEIERFGTRVINTSTGANKFKLELCNRTLQHQGLTSANRTPAARLRYAYFTALQRLKQLPGGLRALLGRKG